MAEFKLNNVAKEDLIRIHQYGAEQFGMKQAHKHFSSFFDHFELIAKNPNAFLSSRFH
jgi:toxin ParE1/3/4